MQIDPKELKSLLREAFKKTRKSIKDKADRDNAVYINFIESNLYKEAHQIFCYAALDDEINTEKIISKALSDGKKVALPVCLDLNGAMQFYYINSFDDIKTGTYGIKEPNTEICSKANDFSGAVCVVPALSFDMFGYRLGYGKGYYDRFLENFTSISVGLCYNSFLCKELPVDKYDKCVNCIFTENKIIYPERRA